ncbi:MAG: DUF1592 domain-containing protein [Verrucomicrobiota bacterium]
MKFRLLVGLPLLLLTGAGADEFSRSVQPLLQKHCYACHGEKKQKGGIELHQITDLPAAFRHHDFLDRVAEQIESGDMPPEDDVMEVPTAEERQTMVRGIRAALAKLKDGDFPPNPGRTTIRRLNRHEYNQTVRDLFGVNFSAGIDFPADGAGGEGFNNVGDALFIPPVLMEKYLAASQRVIDALYESPALLDRILISKPSEKTPPETAARISLTRITSLAFRRRVAPDEIASLLKHFSDRLASGQTFEQAMRVPLQALLIHPAFLFRIEHDEPGKSEWRLDSFEFATRLSYFLWASMPDLRLFQLADQGKLDDPAILRAEIERMLDDPRAESFSRYFAGQWLGFDDIREVADPDTKRFPAFTPALRYAMYRESVEFFNHLIRANRPVSDLIHSDYTFVNDVLAAHYSIPGVTGNKMRKIPLTDPNRGGIIGHASVLTVTSVPLRTSPVKRGKWILDNILGTPPPPPPPDAGVLPADDKRADGLTFRQQLELHRKRPSCAGCHQNIDPLGFGLENYNAIGAWRTTEANGKPVDSLAILPGDIAFSSPAELKRLLASSDEKFLRNFCRKLLAYSIGRPLEYYDEPVISQLVASLRENKLLIRPAIHSVIASKPFRYRSAQR